MFSLGLCLHAQESAGHAEIGFQQYYLAIDSRRIANISGITLNFAQFIPNVGLVSIGLLPAMSSNQFRNGDSYIQLKELPWKAQHWTFTTGDFHVPGQLLPVSFSNITFPEIAARGLAVEATHGARTVGFFYGEGSVSNTPRIILRETVPQSVLGAYWRQRVGKRILLGARFMRFSNDLAALKKFPNLVSQTPFSQVNTLTADSLVTLSKSLLWYGEASWSAAQQEGPKTASRSVPFSFLVGPLLDTKQVTFRANYTFQNASYFPLLGYYLGDRAGPFAEVTYRPLTQLSIYGSVSAYENNVAKDPNLADFQSSSESAGLSMQLPLGFSANGQFTILNLSTRTNASSPWLKSSDRQTAVSLARRFGRQNLRLAVRDFQAISTISPQRLRAVDFQDNFQIKRLTLSAGLTLQRQIAIPSRSNFAYRGSAQFQMGKVSAYANLEIGNDLQNHTLLALNTVSTTTIGGNLNLGRDWTIQAEAYRNNLLTEINPQSIFVLQGQGMFIPGTLAALNQWSIYFRASRSFNWGKAGAAQDLTLYAAGRTPLRGSVEGFVMERLTAGNRPAEGVTVSIDQSLTSITDSEGRFRFAEVAEGPHKVVLAIHELPAEFEAGTNAEFALVVSPGKLSRADLDVIRLGTIQGTVSGPKDVPLQGIVIRMPPGDGYTTPDAEGNFSFYNVLAGTYTLEVDEKTLPEFSVLVPAGSGSAKVQVGGDPAPIVFRFEIHPPVKPVRKVLDKK